MSEIKKTGPIFLLDALGVSTNSISESEKYLEKIRRILDKIKAQRKLQESIIKDGNSMKDFLPDYMNFGDTILIYWEPKETDPHIFLQIVAAYAANLIQSGIKESIVFRGAISYGDYLVDEKEGILLGPAISDAAFWYEKANWIGVIATPVCSYYIRELFERTREDIISNFIEYDVPFKEGEITRMFAVAWPVWYYLTADGDREKNMRLSFFKDFQSLQRPPEAEIKYEAAREFFEYCCRNLKRIVPKIGKPPGME